MTKTCRLLSFFFAIFIAASGICFCQSQQIDSLKLQLQKTTVKKDRILITLELSGKLIKVNLFDALELSNQAVQAASVLKNDSLLMASYLNEGNIYINLGNYPRAMQLLQQAIQGAQKASNMEMLVRGYGNLGSVYYYQHDHKSALKYYLKSLDSYSAIQHLNEHKLLLAKANLMNNVGIIYEEAKKFDSALYFYKEGLDIGTKLSEFEIMANLLNNYGTLYEDQGNLVLAHRYYVEALKLREKHNNRFGLARSYHNLGLFYLTKKENIDSSIYFLNKSVILGSEIGAWQTVGSASDYLYKAYEKAGDYKEALKAMKKSESVKDSLFNEESTRKMTQLEMQFEFDRKQAQLETEQKEKELFFWMGMTGLVSLLIIVTLLFFLQRSKTKRSELEQAHLQLEKVNLKNDISIKDKELATNIMYLLNKNELINHLSEKLLEIKNTAAVESQGPIQKVILDLQANLQPELWQEFEFRFQQVHERFYKALNEQFPDLSPSERRLCAFLKLNMTTKEISAITHQNAKSIDVARTRLRKKLNLTGTDHNLVTFLSQLDEMNSKV